MPLAPGQTLTHYELLGPLGAGGMGEVWRACDTRLEREVAIKVLPEHFADDEERLRRFEREAKTLASLNHPNVAGIHDIDQVGDTCFLAMELVPGGDLEERLARGPLPVDEALDVCRQIAEGLEAAHEAGVVHRDLKPANVRITPEDVVKLLDFGLAKPTPASAAEPGTSSAGTDSFLVTSEGMILGTPTYMSPEQARGKPVDRRTDIWAFGCVLYECLTGKRAFDGEAFGDLMAAILERDPDLDALPKATPAHVRELVRRTLVKDPRQRLRDIGEARLALGNSEGAGIHGRLEGRSEPELPGRSRARLGGLLVAAVAAALALFVWLLQGTERGTGRGLPGPKYVAVEAPAGTRILFSGDFSGPPVVSPDGTSLVFAAVGEQETGSLWLRRLDEPDPRPLPGTRGARFPFWSQDSREIGFFTSDHLCRYDVESGTVSRVLEVGAARGGAFSGDGRILFTTNFRSGLSIVEVNGGEVTTLTTLDEELHTSHRWPSMIQGTDHFLFSAVTSALGSMENNGLYLGTLDSDEPPRRILQSNFSGQVVDGWLLHVKDGSLLAVPYAPDAGLGEDRPRVLVNGLTPDGATWHGQFSASPTGVLAFQRAWGRAQGASGTSYSWTVSGDRVSCWSYEGRELTHYAQNVPMYSMALSPDGRTLAMAALSSDGFTDIWLCPTRHGLGLGSEEILQELASPSPPRLLTFLPGPEVRPVWSPDSSEVAFRWDGDDANPRGIYRKSVGGGSEIFVRDNREGDDHPSDWSPDGRYLIVTTGTLLPSEGNDIVAVPLDGGPEVPLVTEPGAQSRGQVSPDGRWLAYWDTNAPGIFVVPFAPAWPEDQRGGRWLVSDGKAYEPRWSPSGDELHFITESGMLTAVDVETGGETFTHSVARSLFLTRWELGRTYDVAPWYEADADAHARFYMLDSEDHAERPISILLDWTTLLAGEQD